VERLAVAWPCHERRGDDPPERVALSVAFVATEAGWMREFGERRAS
jgi:hypothetical protein